MGRSTRRLAMPSPGRRGIGGAEEAADQVPAAVDAHLVEHDFEVVLHGVPGDVQGVGDAAGWLPAQDEGGDLCFAGGQAVRYEQEGAVSRASRGSTMTVILASPGDPCRREACTLNHRPDAVRTRALG